MHTTCNTSSAYHMLHVVCTPHATHRALITCYMSCAHHMQHIERLSHATCRVHTTCNTSSAYHMLHVVCTPRATHRSFITCYMSCATWYDGTAQLLSLTELKSHFILALFLLAEPLTDEVMPVFWLALGRLSWCRNLNCVLCCLSTSGDV